jgi:hypothetical protein
VPTLASLDDVQSMLGDRDAEQALRAIQGMDDPANTSLEHVRQSTDIALDALDTRRSSPTRTTSSATASARSRS